MTEAYTIIQLAEPDDGDGKQIKATVNGVTTVYVGNHYEMKSGVATKYYFAGATRLAMRTGETLSFLLGDHLGSSSVTTNSNGGLDASALYKAFGETRYTLGNLNTDYHFTGQREEVSLGIYWFQSRWYDAGLGRFTQPDSIVPTGTQGTQAWDRYAFVNNNPVRYNDPTGHMIDEGDEGGCSNPVDGRCPAPQQPAKPPTASSGSNPPYRSTATATINPTLSSWLTRTPTPHAMFVQGSTTTPTPTLWPTPVPLLQQIGDAASNHDPTAPSGARIIGADQVCQASPICRTVTNIANVWDIFLTTVKFGQEFVQIAQSLIPTPSPVIYAPPPPGFITPIPTPQPTYVP